MWILKNKVNEQADQKQTHCYREYSNSSRMGGDLRGWVKMWWGSEVVVTEWVMGI